MSDLILRPPTSRVVEPVSPLDDAHPQYTQHDNSVERQRLSESQTFDTSGSWLATSCDQGTPTCDATEGSTYSANPFKRTVSAKRGIAPGTNLGVSYTDQNSLRSGRIAAGGRVEGAVDTSFDPERAGQSTFDAKGHAQASMEQTGTFEKRSDGRYNVRRTRAGVRAAGGGLGASAAVLGAGLHGGIARTDQSATVRVVDAATVESYRRVHNDVLAAELILQLHEPTSVLDLEVGESEHSDGAIAGEGGTKGVLVGAGLDVAGGGAVGCGRRVERTEKGIVFSGSVVERLEGKGAGSFGVKDLNTGFAEQRTMARTWKDTATITLDPDTDRETLLALESLPDEMLYSRIAALEGAVVTGSEVEQDGGARDLSVGPLAYDRDWSSALTNDGTSLTGVHDDTTHLRAVGQSLGSDGLRNQSSYRDGVLSLSSTTTRTVPGLDVDAKVDLLDPIATLQDLTTVATVDQTMGRSLDDADLQRLMALAHAEGEWDTTASNGRGESNAWQALRRGIAAAGSSEQVAEILVRYAASGGDLEALERLCGRKDLGMSSQWPKEILEGSARMAVLEATVASGPTAADLTAIDVLRNEVAGCTTFTVPAAKDDLLTRLVELRGEAVAHLAERDPTAAADLAYDQGHVAIHAGIQRCADHRDREAALYEGGLGSAPDRALADLRVFYATWKTAVLALRQAYADLEIPEASWAVSPRFTAGADKSPYEPDSVRALRFLEAQGVDSAMHLQLGRWLPEIAC